jgi:hypothetical protein
MNEIDYKIERLQKYFRDPKFGEAGVLRKGDSGAVCGNIKIALRHLGYEIGPPNRSPFSYAGRVRLENAHRGT